MLLEEWNMEDAIAFAREEAREDGREEGRQHVLNLLNQGLTIDEIKQQLEIEQCARS